LKEVGKMDRIDIIATRDPILLVLLGFVLAMTLVVVVLLLKRPSRYPAPGYPPASTTYSNADPTPHLNPGCIVVPLLVTGVVMILAILS
jgi:hypothetical protein